MVNHAPNQIVYSFLEVGDLVDSDGSLPRLQTESEAMKKLGIHSEDSTWPIYEMYSFLVCSFELISIDFSMPY